MVEILLITIPALLAVAGFLIRQMYIVPVVEYRRAKGDIAAALDYYANLYGNPGSAPKEVLLESSNALRKLGTKLTTCIQQLPESKFLRKCFDLPPFEDIRKASSDLIGLSNGVFGTDALAMFGLIDINHKRADEVRKLLKIK